MSIDKSMPIIKDLNGQLLEFGAVKKVLKWSPFLDPALPEWVDQTTGITAEVATDGKPCIVQSVPLSPGVKSLRNLEPLSTSRLSAVRLELRGLECDKPEPDLPGRLQLRLSSGGVFPTLESPGALAEVSSRTTSSLNLSGISAPTQHAAAHLNSPGENANRVVGVNISLLWDILHNVAYLLEGEDVVAWVDGRGRQLAPIPDTLRPVIRAESGVENVWRYSEIIQTYWYD